MDYTIECEICGGKLILDSELSVSLYYSDKPIRFKSTGKIVEESLNEHLVYRCSNCEKCFKYSYKDWELLFRKRLAKIVSEAKLRANFKNIDPEDLDPDRGLEFCGYCEGYDGVGNCLKDIIARCSLR